MNAFCEKLDRQASRLRQQAAGLMAREQTDDANLTKIRANIYEICATIGRVMERTQPREARRQVYLQKLDSLGDSWRSALSLAEAHDDGKQAAIQRIKLEVLEGVREDFCRKEGLQ